MSWLSACFASTKAKDLRSLSIVWSTPRDGLLDRAMNTRIDGSRVAIVTVPNREKRRRNEVAGGDCLKRQD